MTNTQFYLLLTCLILPCALSAQQFGIKVGGNHSFMDESHFNPLEVEGFVSKGGWHIGVYGDLPLGRQFGFQIEALYNRKGVGIDLQDGNSLNANYEYFDWPMLLYYQWRDIQFQLGASAGVIMNHYFYNRELGTRMDFEAGEWQREYDLNALGGIEYQAGRFQLSVRYEVAATRTTKLIEVNQSPNVIVGFLNGGYHRNLMVSVGYALLGD